MDHHFLATLEDEDNRLKQSGMRVEPKPQLAVGPVLPIERLDPLRPIGGLDGVLRQDAMLARRDELSRRQG